MEKKITKLTRRGFIGNAGVLASGIALVPQPVAETFQNFFSNGNERKYTVAIYYWPNFHKDAYHQSKKGTGWTEWEIVKHATPKFEGHYQPKIPLWGYRDESDPREMARSINAMADAGIDSIIFDWYRYDDNINGGMMIEKALQDGFLKAPNRNRIKFSLMWANHDYIDCHPFATGVSFNNAPIWRKGEVGSQAFRRHTQDAIESYFKQPNYWLIKGCPYFSIYRLDKLIRGLGGIAGTRDALQDFRSRVQAAGFPDLHLNVVDSGATLTNEIPKLIHAESAGDKLKIIHDLLSEIKADSATMYTWVHHLWPMLVKNSEENKENPKSPAFGFTTDLAAERETNIDKKPEGKGTHYSEKEILKNALDAGIVAVDYSDYGERAMKVFDERLKGLGVVYFPHVSMGWDGSPRNYSMGMALNNTPKKWERFLRETKSWLDQHPESEGIVTLNSWNEWVEGSYIEPDTEHGMQYLNAVRKVFGS
ncbi:glycoside hydrolase family 99-like domain-containing protein [Agriterribacter sp.]|uniref:glycoside hydrolase family 99-like domain-containing protein n=1 Tax=Agriterribacter sp. TaxID=2821509 RepID=UPI002BE44A94|nr:glycoside hydrolase family 99-like domain-containing protein [Agriterribacter sp.]HRP55319.1 glycoside hydrolase family 99-like domain-containing protein [Agriterribacter sp.]